MWTALLASGVDPVVAGLAIGLSATAYTPARGQLEEATHGVKLFREQPTPELARTATAGIASTLSVNERLQAFLHPVTSFVIVPLFALANAGIELNASFLRTAYTAPITIGVLIGYVVGKPIAVVATSWIVARLSGGTIRPPVGWGAVLGSGTLAGVGFTVALLIADRAFTGADLAEAKLGALSAAVLAAALTWLVYRLTALLAPARRARALIGDVRVIQDLVPEVDPERDHIRGPVDASTTVIEFGDFECPYCGRAEAVARELLADGDVRFVWGTCRSPTCTRPRSSPPRRPRPRPGRDGSGRCTTCCSSARTISVRPTCSATPVNSGSTSSASTTTSNAACTRRGWRRTSSRPM